MKERYYAKPLNDGRFELGTIVNGVPAPAFKSVSYEDAYRTGRDLIDMGVELGPEFAINCTSVHPMKSA